MTERPILFSAPMVRAVLAGTKTQTRRLVKPSPGLQRTWLDPEGIGRVPHGEMKCGGWQMHHPLAGQTLNGIAVESDSPLGWVRCPYGAAGDRLWVRETWASADRMYRSDESDGPPGTVAYRADRSAIQFEAEPRRQIPGYDLASWNWDVLTWKPSIHMPRWASRIDLEVTSVRVERLNDISKDDAIAEGARSYEAGSLAPSGPSPFANKGPGWSMGDPTSFGETLGSPQMAFANAWNVIAAGPEWNLKAGPSPWDLNPWVWVVAFKRLRP